MAPNRSHRERASASSSLSAQGRNRCTPYPSQRSSNEALVEKASSSSTPSSCSPTPSSTSSGATWRDVMVDMIGEKFPDFEPRSDFEIFVLGTTKYLGNRAELGTWLDGKLALQLRHGSDLETIMERARNALATPSSTITGFKPKEGESNPQILVRPIPRSRYSIRLFPGSPHVQEYCLDFVDTQTGRPVNSPFKFELWSIPNPSTPWSGLGSYRVYSLEQSFRVPQPDIIPGDEKFVLRDGQTCLLKRPGHKDVRFTVPVRHQPIPPLPPAADVLDLPSEIPA